MSTPRTMNEVAVEAFQQLGKTTDRFERYDNAHASRISVIADEIAKLLNMASQDRRSLRAAALLHDVGETVMERDYIGRAGTLSDEERIDLARHPVIGEHEARRAGADRATQLLVRWHHEWWNGCGYPDALRADEIPLGARILRVADSYAALTDHRPFRSAMTRENAQHIIVDGAGIEFDPRITSLFLSLGRMQELESFAGSALVEETNLEPRQERDLFSPLVK